MRGDWDVVRVRILESGDMVIDGITGFIAGNIEAYDMVCAAPEFFHQLYRLHALFFGEMPQGTEEETHLNARFSDAFVNGCVDGFDDLVGGEAFFQVFKGGKPELGIDDVLFF